MSPLPPAMRRALPSLVLCGLALGGCDLTGSSAPGALPEDCVDQTRLPTMSPGDWLRLSGRELATLCPSVGEHDREYVLVLHHASGLPADSTHIRIQGVGLDSPGAEPRPPSDTPVTGPQRAPVIEQSSPGGFGHPGDPPALHRDQAQHLELREVERRELAPRVRPGVQRTPGSASAPPRAPRAVPAIGDLLEFNAGARSPACEDPTLRTGRVEAISDRALVVADTLNPAGGFRRSDFQHYAATFDTLITPLAEETLGVPSDIDGNGRVILFFTQEVNRLSQVGADSFVGGFFFSRDLFPVAGTANLAACQTSNEAEILYLLVPDPAGQINGNPRSMDFLRRITLATLAHEYQHLINASQRLHVHPSAGFPEETWLNEGLSHIAEELLFFRTSGLGSRSNLDVETLRDGGSHVLDALNRHQLPNVQRLRTFMADPATQSPYNARDALATRGAAWHLLRYAADRPEREDATFFRRLVAGPQVGVANLSSATGGDAAFRELTTDWSVSLYADSRLPELPTRFQDLSWNHFSLLRTLAQQAGDSDPPYPLAIRRLSPDGETPLQLMGGGSAYLRYAVGPGADPSLLIRVDGGAPPGELQGTLLRIR
jgi:hypothetical protein